MRYSLDLCDEETDFRQKRKRVVFETMKKLLGERGPKELGEVTTLLKSKCKMNWTPKIVFEKLMNDDSTFGKWKDDYIVIQSLFARN